MIERLNFFDIYGYLLPGLLLVGLLCLPFWLSDAGGGQAESEAPGGWRLTEALAGVILGYLAGHLLYSLSQGAFTSRRTFWIEQASPDQAGGTTPEPVPAKRHPSDYLLDDDDGTIEGGLKEGIAAMILKRFGVDVRGRKADHTPQRERRRDLAFRLCRTALVRSGLASYAEQYNGMYILARGVAAASVLGAAYHLGWSAGRFLAQFGQLWEWLQNTLVVLSIVAGGLVLVAAFSHREVRQRFRRAGASPKPRHDPTVGWRRWASPLLLERNLTLSFWLLAVLLLVVGCLLAGSRGSSMHRVEAWWFAAVFGACVFAGSRFWVAMREWSVEFALAVYRDYVVLEIGPDFSGRGVGR